MTGGLVLRERPTFTQMFGAQLLRILLLVVCAMVAVFLLAWLFTRSSLAQVQDLLGASSDPTAVLETLRELRRDHFDQVRGLFQLLVLSGLIPLVTLFAGYTFGTRGNDRQPASEDDGNAS
jgi:hypothetical protein